jgi:hypothetical protein
MAKLNKQKILAIIAFPLIFLPGLLTGLFSDIIIKPTIWWVFHLIYAISCLISIGILWLILKFTGFKFKDIGFKGFRASHVGWALLFFFCAIIVWYLISILLSKLNIPIEWGREIKFAHCYEAIIIFIISFFKIWNFRWVIDVILGSLSDCFIFLEKKHLSRMDYAHD